MGRRRDTEIRPAISASEANLELCQNEVGRLRSQVACLKATIRRLRAELRAERHRR